MSQHRVLGSLKLNPLLGAAAKMRESLHILKQINSKASIISLNAAIEGARTRGRLDSFSTVAEQISAQTNRNNELSEQLEALVSKLQSVALSSTAARYYEIAEDLIDKLDRNLFERNCDVQAWAGFEAIVICAKEFASIDTDRARALVEQRDPTTVKACLLLERLMATYMIYADAFLVNKEGIIIAAGKRKNLVGKNVVQGNWFKTSIAGKIHISDMEHDELIDGFSVSYSAPVHDSDGAIIGVASTRFNWEFAQEMIDNAGYESNMSAYICSKEGVILGSSGGIGVMRDSVDWLESGIQTMKGSCGYSCEKSRNGIPIAVGCARTKGYNSYRGKEWSALILAKLGNVEIDFFYHEVQKRNGGVEVASVGTNSNDEVVRKAIESEKANFELQKTMDEINNLVSMINSTNNETNMLAINAAIQAGIAGTEGESFAVIAAEIGKLAEKSVAFVKEVNMTAEELRSAVDMTVAARLIDAAKDTIDKVDRNLFERFCDVQAWTTFDKVVEASVRGDESGVCSDFLAKLYQIYEVYHDIFLLDLKGNIVSSAVRRDLRGQNQSNRSWFQEAVDGKICVTEVYNSFSANGLTMSFAAPVIGSDGKISGVLTTRFNWNFIYGIIDAVIADSRSKVYLVNSAGVVIAASDRQGILEKNIQKNDVFKEMSNKKSGHIVENDPETHENFAVGFAKTPGYNSYKGKGWSIVIRRPIGAQKS